METMQIIGIAFILVGVGFLIRNRRVSLYLARGRVRGIADPAFIILGVLLVLGILG